MIGSKKNEQKLFYYLHPEELIPEDHVLRLIDNYVDFSFVRPKVEHLYSDTGRPSVDPDVMMRMLLVGYLFGITSERRLCDEVSMHLGYRWFVGLDWMTRYQTIPRFLKIVMDGSKKVEFTSTFSTRLSSSASKRGW